MLKFPAWRAKTFTKHLHFLRKWVEKARCNYIVENTRKRLSFSTDIYIYASLHNEF